MKKFLLISFLALAVSGMLYAETSDNSSGESGLSLGAFVEYQPAMGPLADYVEASFGGGVVVEYILPFLSNDGFSLGISGHVSGNVNPVSSELLSFMWNIKGAAGIFAKIHLGQTAFYLVPEVSYGAVINFPTTNPKYENELAAMYVDQMIQVAAGIRFNPSFLGGKLEFEAAPVYTLCTEQTEMVHYLGARVGFLIKL